MLYNMPTYYPDGSMQYEEVEIPNDAFSDKPEPYIPTIEDRLAALESAMLSMMGVSTDV